MNQTLSSRDSAVPKDGLPSQPTGGTNRSRPVRLLSEQQAAQTSSAGHRMQQVGCAFTDLAATQPVVPIGTLLVQQASSQVPELTVCGRNGRARLNC